MSNISNLNGTLVIGALKVPVRNITDAILDRTPVDLIQKRFIEKYYDIVDINIPTIEKIGGGSVRCMLLELF